MEEAGSSNLPQPTFCFILDRLAERSFALTYKEADIRAEHREAS